MRNLIYRLQPQLNVSPAPAVPIKHHSNLSKQIHLVINVSNFNCNSFSESTAMNPQSCQQTQNFEFTFGFQFEHKLDTLGTAKAAKS